jgi:hypothetical protein
MSLVHRLENVATIVTGIIIVAAKMRVLSLQSFMLNLVVFDDWTLLFRAKTDFEDSAK